MIPSDLDRIGRSTFGDSKLRAHLLRDLQRASAEFRRRLASELHRSGCQGVLRLIEKAAERSGVQDTRQL